MEDGNGISGTEPARVLVVEDNPFNREMLGKILIQEGCIVDEARNGREAIEKLKGSSYRIIFMDILMPKMDGIETIQRIRAMAIPTPIIIVTAMSSDLDRRRCLEAGGDGFLTKPLDIEQIREQVERFLETPAKTGESSLNKDSATASSAGSASVLSGHRALLVEEEAEQADRFVRILAACDMTVERVASGTRAWELINDERRRFDLVISNMFTSGIDGMGLLARIKREFANVPVFIYAAEEDADAFNLANRLGADGVLTESEFRLRIRGMMESAVYRAGRKTSRANSASTVRQVRQAREQLIRTGCPGGCDRIDIAHMPLTDAGGDLALCRKFPETGRCGILLGDVAGHSVMTSYVSAMFLGVLSTLWGQTEDPTDLLSALNRELNKPAYDHQHVCAVVLSWDPNSGLVKAATAGNPGGLLVGKNPEGAPMIRDLGGGGMALGLIPEDTLFGKEEIRIQPGDWMFLFSDGVDKNALLGILESGEVDLGRDAIRGISREILHRLTRRTPQTDDMILMSLRHPLSEGRYRNRLTISASYRGVDTACDWIEGLPGWRIPTGHDASFVRIALREAFLNAVMHGNRLNPNSSVDIDFRSGPEGLRITVTDTGPGFAIPRDVPSMAKVGLLQKGGRGLAAIMSVADDFRVDGGAVTLVFQNRIL